MKLQSKILLSILVTSLLIFALTVGHLSYQSRERALKDSKEIVDAYAREYSNFVMAELNRDMHLSRGLAHAFLGYHDIPQGQRRQIYNDMLRNIFINNPGYLSVWTSWELSAYDSIWTKTHGRKRTEIHYINGQVTMTEDSLDLDDQNVGSTYHNIKLSKQETITIPYYYSYTRKKEDEKLVSSICVPILENDNFIGLAGVDVGLERFQEITDSIQPFKGSFAFLLAHNGHFVAHPDKNHINASIKEVKPDYLEKFDVINKINQGQEFSFITTSDSGIKRYLSFAPFVVGKSTTPWAIGISVPLSSITAEADRHFYTTLLVGIGGLILLLVVTYSLAKYIVKPLKKITRILKSLAIGNLNETHQMSVKTKDEIGQIRQSVNVLINSLKRTAHFAQEIGKGNLDIEFSIVSKNDVLGNSLLEMKQSLKKAEEQKSEREELDRRQNWSSHGIAKFSEILRENQDNIEEFGYQIISNMVKYLDANQGGIFVVDDTENENPMLEMIAAYAYNRRKYLETVFEPGIGLVGRCFQEEETIFMTDIPDNYIKITSGLGDENPSCLLLVPLKMNEKVFGVIELASFKIVESYQIEFVERIAESVASTLSTIKINIRTAELLEESQNKSEMLSTHEEEMRQNMEELRATQEEMERKNKEIDENMKMLTNIIDLVPFPVFVKNIKGEYIIANQAQAQLFHRNSSQIIDKTDQDLLRDQAELNRTLDTDRQVIENHKTVNLPAQKITLADGAKKILQTTKVPLYNNLTNNTNVLGVSIDLTEKEKDRKELEKRMKALQKAKKQADKKQVEADSTMKMLRNIIDMVPFPIFMKNQNSQYIIVNRAQANLFGLQPEDMIGTGDDEILDDINEIREIKTSDFKVLNNKTTVQLPKQEMTTPKGVKFVLQTTKVPFENNVTSELNILGVSVDLTDKKALEKENKLTRQQAQEREKYLENELEQLRNELEKNKNNNDAEE